MGNFLFAVGGAAARYNDLYDAGIKLKATQAKTKKDDTTFVLGIGNGAISRDKSPFDSDTAGNVLDNSTRLYEEFVQDERNISFIQLVNSGQGNELVSQLRDAKRDNEANVLDRKLKDFIAIRNQAVRYYTDPQKGEGGAIVGYRDLPDYFNNDPEFKRTVNSNLNLDGTQTSANINTTLKSLNLDVQDNLPSTVDKLPPVNINYGFNNETIATIDPNPRVDEAPISEETPSLRNWGINSLDPTWRKYSLIGLENEEAEAWGNTIIEQGKVGRLDNVIKFTASHIPKYLEPEKQGSLLGLLTPAEIPLTQSERDYNKTRAELGKKVLDITDEMYEIILDPVKGIGIVAASANWQNLIDRYGGAGGVIDQVFQLGRNIKSEGYVLGTNVTQNGKRTAVGKTREEEIKFLNSLGIDSDMTISEHMANVNKVGGAARLESLTISLAFAIAIANQDFQGGKAVSDADFRQAYLQVTGGSSQGSLFRGFSKPVVFLSTVKQVRDGLIPAVMESKIFQEVSMYDRGKGKEKRTTAFIMKGLENGSVSDLIHLIKGEPDRFDNLLKDAYAKAKNISRMEGTQLRNLGFGETLIRRTPFVTTDKEAEEGKLEKRANNAMVEYLNRN